MSTPYGAIIGAISDTAGGIASSVLNRQASSQSWDRQKYAMKHAVRWRAKDLQAAGFNRVLAATNGATGVNTPMSQSTNFSSSGLAAGMAADNQRRQTKASKSLMERQEDLTDAQTGLTRANESVAYQDRLTKKSQELANSASTMWTKERTKTEGSQQMLNRELALAAANSAENLAELRKGIQADNKGKQAVAEIYDDPIMRKIMQARALLPIDAIVSGGAQNLFPNIQGKKR